MAIQTEKRKAEFLLTAAGTEKSHMLKNTWLARHGTNYYIWNSPFEKMIDDENSGS